MEPNNFLPPERAGRDPWAPETDAPAMGADDAGDSTSSLFSAAAPAEESLDNDLFGGESAAGESPRSDVFDMDALFAPHEESETDSFDNFDNFATGDSAQVVESAEPMDNGFDLSDTSDPGALAHDPAAPGLEVHELVEAGPKVPRFAPKQLLGAGLAVAVLAAGSAVAFGQLNSSGSNASSDGGGATAELVVEQFMDAVETEDFLGAAQLMEPTERRTLINPGMEMVGELQRLGVLANEFDMSSVQGLDVQLADMVYSPEPLSSSVVRVSMSGEVTTVSSGESLPVGSLITDNMDADELAEMLDENTETSVESLDDMGIVAVERDGAWFVSLWYSIAEGIRNQEQIAELPSFGNGPAPTGGETPEAAVQAMVDAAADLNVRGVIASLDPQEAAALYDYSTLFLDDVDAEVANMREEATFNIDRLDLASVVDGDDAVVSIDAIAVTVTMPERTVVFDTAADCIVTTPEGCEISKEDMAAERMSPDMLNSEIAARKVDGVWYVSPMSTLFQPMLAGMADLDQATLQGWIDDPESMLESDSALTRGGMGAFGVFGLGAFPLLGTSTMVQFDEVTVDEWENRGEWMDEDGFPTTTVGPDEPGFTLPEGIAPVEGSADEPGFTLPEGTTPPQQPGNDDGPVFTLPDSVIVPETTNAAQTTTIAPVRMVTVFEVQVFAPAGTSAFDLKAEMIEMPAEDVPDYSITSEETQALGAATTAVDLEPATILIWDHFNL